MGRARWPFHVKLAAWFESNLAAGSGATNPSELARALTRVLSHRVRQSTTNGWLQGDQLPGAKYADALVTLMDAHYTYLIDSLRPWPPERSAKLAEYERRNGRVKDPEVRRELALCLEDPVYRRRAAKIRPKWFRDAIGALTEDANE